MVVVAVMRWQCALLCTTPPPTLHPRLHPPPSPICLRKGPRNLFRRATLRFLTFSLLSHERYRIGATCRLRTQITGATGATGGYVTEEPISHVLARVGLDHAKSREDHLERDGRVSRLAPGVASPHLPFSKAFPAPTVLLRYIICFDYIIISSHSPVRGIL